MLAKLGEEALKIEGDYPAFATRTADGRIIILLWNETPLEDNPLKIKLDFAHLTSQKNVRHYRIDRNYSNAFRLYQKMGSPETPSVQQIKTLKESMDIELCEPLFVVDKINCQKEIILPSHAVSLLELL